MLEHCQNGCSELCMEFLPKESSIEGTKPHIYCSYSQTTGSILGQSLQTNQPMQYNLQDYFQDFGKQVQKSFTCITLSPFYQSAFVPSSTIQDNAILAHKLLHSLKSKKRRGGFMAIKTDIEKTFDKIE
jgi:hypothetical protein